MSDYDDSSIMSECIDNDVLQVNYMPDDDDDFLIMSESNSNDVPQENNIVDDDSSVTSSGDDVLQIDYMSDNDDDNSSIMSESNSNDVPQENYIDDDDDDSSIMSESNSNDVPQVNYIDDDDDDSSIMSESNSSDVPQENYMSDDDDSTIMSESNSNDVPQENMSDDDVMAECNGNDVSKICVNAKDYTNPALNTPLYLAVHSGDLDLVRTLIKDITPEEKNQKRSLMHTAAVRGQAGIVKLLYDLHFPVNDVDDSGNTPLHLAILENHQSVFDFFMTKSTVNIDALNLKGETPLYIALTNKNIEIAETLIKNGANVSIRDNGGQSPLHIAADIKSFKLVENILRKGAEVNVMQNGRDLTPLHLAARQNQMQIVEFLIENGASITEEDRKDPRVLKLMMQPLNYAIRNRNMKMVQLLMMNEFNAIDVEDYAGETPLSLAVNNNDFQMLKYLIQHGRTINPKIEINTWRKFHDLQSENLLKRSLCTGSLEIWKYLLQCSTKIDGIMISSFHSAIREGNYERVKEMIKTEDDKYSINGRLAVYMAVECQEEEILKLLLEEGYSFESCFNDKSPIHTAATFDHPRLVQLLMKFGADLNSITINKQTPLHFATAAGQLKVVEFLLNAGCDFKKYKNYNSPLTFAICRGHETESIWVLTPTVYQNILKITELLLIAGINDRTNDDIYDELLHSATKIRVAQDEIVENSENELIELSNDDKSIPYIGNKIFICLLNYLSNGEIKRLSMSIAQTYDFNHYPLEFIHLILEYNEYDLELSEIYLWNINCFENYLLIIGHIGRFYKYPKYRIEQILRNEFIMSKNYKRRVKMLVARFILLSNDSYSESEEKFYKEYKLYDWCHECERQIFFMKESEIVNDCSITFYDILTHSVDRVALYIRNENLLRVLESAYMNFPAYADFLRLSVDKGKRRRDLVDECINCMFSMIRRNYNIQFTTVDIVKIFDYLSVVDLRRLLGAFS
ncbi:ankyrin-3-like [Leptopilina heterotoma]|uniref:ankyrin-3-like n=1 Tax=Leptopilina heterotoma TaxID=63436 RepID=UPI001CA9E49D|nr:ankyrin-3-like [Leptopilina heterotoma]